MSNRTTDPDTIGLEAWLEDTRIVLPLRALSVRADITAGFADVEVDQFFEQNNTQPLDCRFLFPLPADAAAYRCEMHVNGRVILAKVEERAAARKHFKELKASGRRAALAESERDNLFTLQLGNVQPGDRILMRFAYLQPVQRLREQRTLRIPVNPGVRYIPGEPLLRDNTGPGTVDDTDLVPDASRITTPRIAAEHSDAAALHATVRLRGAGELAEGASSPSHPIAMKRNGEDLVAALAANGHLPDRDFIFTWSEKPPVAPIFRTWLDANRRGLLEIRLPSSDRTRHRVAQGLSAQTPVQVTGHSTSTPVDVYFLLDRSGSMAGDNWTGACKALSAFVPRLHPDTRVWLSLFESGIKDYDSALVRAGDLDLGPDGAKILRHGTAGGTELVPALRHIGKKIKEHGGGHPAAALIITDGEIGNEAGAVAAAAKLGCPVHIVGVAMTANDGLDALARESGGRCIFLAPGEDIAGAVERFAPVLRAPVVTGLTMPAGWTAADEKPLRDLCDGDDLVVAISATPDAPELSLTCTSTELSNSGVSPQLIRSRSREAGLLWARSRIRHLDAKKDGKGALAIAKEFNMLSRDGAFIAWDEAERVPIAQSEIIQPALDTAMYSMRSCRLSAASFDQDSSMDFAEAPLRLRESRTSLRKHGRGPRTTGSKAAPPSGPDMEFICKQALALTELLRNELPWLFREHPAPDRLMDAIRELHEFAATGSNEPEAGKIGLLLIEQLCQELDRAFAEQHHRLHDEIARLSEELARRKHQLAQLDALREKSSQLQELQKAFRLLEV